MGLLKSLVLRVKTRVILLLFCGGESEVRILQIPGQDFPPSLSLSAVVVVACVQLSLQGREGERNELNDATAPVNNHTESKNVLLIHSPCSCSHR